MPLPETNNTVNGLNSFDAELARGLEVDSGDELADVMSLLPANAKLQDVTEALKDTQLQNIELRSQLKKLQLNEVSRQTDDREGRKRKSKAKGLPEALIPHEDDIAKLARKFSLTVCPWLEIGEVGKKGRPDIDINSDSRFTDPTKKEAGRLAELYDYLPKDFHKLLESYSKFESLFRHHLNNQRSNAVLNVRQKAGVLFGLDQKYFSSLFPRGTIPELQKLLKLPDKDEYTIFAPVLFKDYRYDSTRKTLFLNDLIPGIIRTMLFGRSEDAKSKPQTLAQRWGVKEATPGLIAFAAILARYLISPETELRPARKDSEFNWLQDFEAYKWILTTKSKRIQKIYDHINEKAFAIKPATKGATTSNAANNANEIEMAIRQLNDDSSSDVDIDENFDTNSRPASPFVTPLRMISPPRQAAPTERPSIVVDIRLPLPTQVQPNTTAYNSVLLATESSAQQVNAASPLSRTASVPPEPQSEAPSTTTRRLSSAPPPNNFTTTSRRSSAALPLLSSGPTSRRSSGLVPSFLPPPADIVTPAAEGESNDGEEDIEGRQVVENLNGKKKKPATKSTQSIKRNTRVR